MKRLFDHVVQSSDPKDLSEIRADESVNLVIYNPATDPVVRDYVTQLDLEDLFAALSDSQNDPRFVNLGQMFMPRNDGAGDQSPAMEYIMDHLPEGPGRTGFINQLEHYVRAFNDAAGYDEVIASLDIVKPGKAYWHRDVNTDLRGLVTFTGAGTLWVSNETVADKHPPSFSGSANFYGLPYNGDLMDQARQMENHTMAIWKGDQHQKPLIHSEPVTDQGMDEDLRMRFLINRHQPRGM